MDETAETNARILIVEDDPQLSAFLEDLLASHGYAVATADDGVEGLQKLQEQQFDLALIDVWMPRMNGLELLTRLRASPPATKAPPKAIIMTAYDAPETLLRAVKEQAYRYITKPFSSRTVLETVQAVLESPSSLPPIEVLSARPNWVELLLPCQIESADRVESFLRRLEADIAEEVRDSVGKVFRELLLNAIEWGGKMDPSRKVRISFVRARRMLLYRIADPGAGFRFEDLSHAAISNPPDDPYGHMRARQEKGLRPGGFGLLLAQAMVDEVIYNEAQNEVMIIKYLDAPAVSETRSDAAPDRKRLSVT